jgi:hypothetical protein
VLNISSPLNKDFFVHGKVLDAAEYELVDYMNRLLNDVPLNFLWVKTQIDESISLLEGSGLVQIDFLSVSFYTRSNIGIYKSFFFP